MGYYEQPRQLGRTRGRSEHGDSVRFPPALFVVLALCGVCFLAAGLSRAHAASKAGPQMDERRSTLLRRFADATSVWEASERPRLEATALRLLLEPDFLPAAVCNLTSHDEADLPLPIQSPGLPQWQPLVMRGTFTSTPAILGWRNPHAVKLTVQAWLGPSWVSCPARQP